MKLALMKVDEPQSAGWAQNEVAQVRVAETNTKFGKAFPQCAELLPKTVAHACRLFGFTCEIRAQRASFDVGINEIRIEPHNSPTVFDTRNRPRRGDARIREPMRERPCRPGS